MFYLNTGSLFWLPYKNAVILPMPFNAHNYLHHMETLDLSEEQKLDIIHSVAAMVETIVDNSFEDHPVHHLFAGQQVGDSKATVSQIKSGDQTYIQKFKEAAANTNGRSNENDKS